MKLLNTILLFSFFGLMDCNTTKTNISENCDVKKIKYLSTYVDSRMWGVGGGDSEFDLKATQEILSQDDEKLEFAILFIPMLLNNIEGFYSDGILEPNEQKLIKEFSKIFARTWKNNSFLINEEDSETQICNKVNLIIEEYHQLSEDDSEFYKMILTLDDGPFMGIDTDVEMNLIEEVSLGDQKLILRGNETENTLEVISKSGKLLWRKIIARSAEYKIRRLYFANNPIRVNNALGYKIALIGDGELVQLYLNRNGDFRLFFHSW